MKTFAVFVVLVAICISSSSALRCYNCVFPNDSKCQTPKDLQGEECSEPNAAEKALGIKNACLKTVIDVSNVKTITRSCTKEGGNINPCTVIKEHVEFCGVCYNDLCNGSTNLLINAWSVMMPIALALFMKFF